MCVCVCGRGGGRGGEANHVGGGGGGGEWKICFSFFPYSLFITFRHAFFYRLVRHLDLYLFTVRSLQAKPL